MSSANINTQAAAAREGARTGSGQFGHQQHGVDPNANEALPTPVDWKNKHSVIPHLHSSGLDGEVTYALKGDRFHDDNIGNEHLLYSSAGGRTIAFGPNSVGTLLSSNIGADAGDGYFATDHAPTTLPGALIQETLDNIVEADYVSGGFNQALSSSENYGLIDGNMRVVDGHVRGEMTISDLDEGDYFIVSYDGATGTTRISDEYNVSNEVSPELAARILEDIQPITYEENEPRQLSVGEVFTNALDQVKTDPDFSPSLAQRMGIS